jgi:hypothetical protein
MQGCSLSLTNEMCTCNNLNSIHSFCKCVDAIICMPEHIYLTRIQITDTGPGGVGMAFFLSLARWGTIFPQPICTCRLYKHVCDVGNKVASTS